MAENRRIRKNRLHFDDRIFKRPGLSQEDLSERYSRAIRIFRIRRFSAFGDRLRVQGTRRLRANRSCLMLLWISGIARTMNYNSEL